MPANDSSSHSATIQGERLYGIAMRPQELAVYGDKVTFSLRYSPIFEEADELADRHFRLLVLEIDALESGDAGGTEVVGKERARRAPLQLLKCGWELELQTAGMCRVDCVIEEPTEVPFLLGRIADTVNELARRAGLEAPLGPALIADLLTRYTVDSGKT